MAVTHKTLFKKSWALDFFERDTIFFENMLDLFPFFPGSLVLSKKKTKTSTFYSKNTIFEKQNAQR